MADKQIVVRLHWEDDGQLLRAMEKYPRPEMGESPGWMDTGRIDTSEKEWIETLCDDMLPDYSSATRAEAAYGPYILDALRVPRDGITYRPWETGSKSMYKYDLFARLTWPEEGENA